jgi:hypothetical protein
MKPLQSEKKARFFSTFLISLLLTICFMASADAMYDINEFRAKLKRDTGIDYSEEDIYNRFGKNVFTNPQKEPTQQSDGLYLSSGPSAIDELIAKHPDRDPEVLREGYNQVLENLENGAFPTRKPISVDSLEKLGKERIKKKFLHDWGVFIAFATVLTFLAGAVFLMQKRKTQQKGSIINEKQNYVLIAVAAIILAMLLYSPFQYLEGDGRVSGAGYNLLWDAPSNATVDIATLITQWVGVLIIGGIAFLVLKDK